MNISRLLAYGITGIFVGLLVENQALIVRQRALKIAIRKKKALLEAVDKPRQI